MYPMSYSDMVNALLVELPDEDIAARFTTQLEMLVKEAERVHSQVSGDSGRQKEWKQALERRKQRLHFWRKLSNTVAEQR